MNYKRCKKQTCEWSPVPARAASSVCTRSWSHSGFEAILLFTAHNDKIMLKFSSARAISDMSDTSPQGGKRTAPNIPIMSISKAVRSNPKVRTLHKPLADYPRVVTVNFNGVKAFAPAAVFFKSCVCPFFLLWMWSVLEFFSASCDTK